uniref:Uncharacterized protein n=1 Tax=Anguilla anguilla TaxID=7936 RepID=A0A0E9PG10_ANGAN
MHIKYKFTKKKRKQKLITVTMSCKRCDGIVAETVMHFIYWGHFFFCYTTITFVDFCICVF